MGCVTHVLGFRVYFLGLGFRTRDRSPEANKPRSREGEKPRSPEAKKPRNQKNKKKDPTKTKKNTSKHIYLVNKLPLRLWLALRHGSEDGQQQDNELMPAFASPPLLQTTTWARTPYHQHLPGSRAAPTTPRAAKGAASWQNGDTAGPKVTNRQTSAHALLVLCCA